MEKVTHTATPWKLGPTIYEHMGAEIRGGDGEGHGIAQVWSKPNGYRDAEFIVRAVNCHEALVQALRSLRNEAAGFLAMADPVAHGQTNLNCLQRRIDQADNALATADATAQG